MPNKRKYNDRWSEDQTIAFIDARIELDEIFTKRAMDVRSAWERVGAKAGIYDEWTRLRKKWTNLMEKYKIINKQENDKPFSRTWIFYNKMHIFYSKHQNNDSTIIVNNEVEPSSSSISNINSELEADIKDCVEKVDVHNSSAINQPMTCIPNTLPKNGISLSTTSFCNLPVNIKEELDDIYIPSTSIPPEISKPDNINSKQDKVNDTCNPTTTTQPEILQPEDMPNVQPSLSTARSDTHDKELKTSLLKTEKEIRKACRAFTKFLSQNFNIEVESSDSE